MRHNPHLSWLLQARAQFFPSLNLNPFSAEDSTLKAGLLDRITLQFVKEQS